MIRYCWCRECVVFFRQCVAFIEVITLYGLQLSMACCVSSFCDMNFLTQMGLKYFRGSHHLLCLPTVTIAIVTSQVISNARYFTLMTTV